MTKRERVSRWPKNAIGTKLEQFNSTVVLLRSREEWNCAVSYLQGKPISQIEATHLAGDYAGLATYYAKSDRAKTMFLAGVFDGKRRTLLHELDHVTFDICGYYGIPTKAGDPNEFHCYMLEFLFSELEKYVIPNATPTA